MPTTISGNTGVSQVQAGSITAADLDGAQTGSAPIYGCRAWVNFDGTKDTTGATSTANTNRLIRGSGNVTSVLRNGTGDYTITFTTAMPDANYGYSCSGSTSTRVPVIGANNTNRPTASALRVLSYATANTATEDVLDVCVTIFR
jgi:hypothetical protein